MIVRVKKICQVGVFREFKTGGSVEFTDGKKITMVFGRNTKGKSTFSAILKSIGDNDPTLINDRGSIPADRGVAKEIELSYKLNSKEENLKFTSGAWGTNELTGNILVFDQDFVHRNVIAGDSITRDNKEKFTDFVLGADGVLKSEQIEEKKKLLRAQKSNLPTFRPPHVKYAANEIDITKYINLEVKEDTPKLEKDKESQEKRLLRLDRIDEFKKIVLPTITIESAEASATSLIKELVLILNEDYKDVSDEAWQALQQHIGSNCNDDAAVSWLKTGNKINTSTNCPYCAQDLAPSRTLIQTYQTIFDEKFEEYEKRVKTRISDFKTMLQLESAQLFATSINRFIAEASKFNPFVPELESEIAAIEVAIKSLSTSESDYRRLLALWITEAQDLLDTKELSIHKSLNDTSKTDSLLEQARIVAQEQASIKSIAERIIKHIENAKEKIDHLNSEQIAAEKQRLNTDISLITKKIARIREDADCAIYKTKAQDIVDLQKEIVTLTDDLEKEQSEYLDTYFQRLDYWFKKLGSDEGFEIEKSTNRKGDKKVYSLSLTYNGQPIPQDQITKVFSESDKRNLALSVFMSRAEKLDKKSEKILVLDDPVVSFDDNRIRLTCRELKAISSDFAQIIITTHYISLIKESIDCSMPAQYIEIESVGKKSSMKVLDAAKLTLSPHERDCDKICLFIDGSNDYGVFSNLRPFMEQHLRIRFQQQITNSNFGGLKLGELITKLKDEGLISDNAATRLHGFRESLNPDHHAAIDDENIEEARLEARDLLSLLYSDLGSL